MKQILLILVIFLVVGNIYGQSNNCLITHTNGTAQILGIDVTVSSNGIVDTMTTYCPSSTYPYLVGGNQQTSTHGNGEYSFSFSPPADTIALNFSGITDIAGFTEEVQLYVNGAHFPLSSVGLPNGCDSLAIITGSGNIRACPGCNGSGWNGTIIYGPISTLTVKDTVISGTPGGTVFSIALCANYDTVTTAREVENDFGNKLLLYPNPTDGNFSIDLGETYNSVTITITELSGKLIQSKVYNHHQLLNLKLDKPAGVYLLMIESGDKKAMIRLVKE